jgi:hypothetical protein
LEWTDIDWQHSTLRVTSKPHWKFRIKDSEERDIPIPASLLDQLKERKALDIAGLLVLPTKAGKPNGKLLRTLKRLANAEGLNCGAVRAANQKMQNASDGRFISCVELTAPRCCATALIWQRCKSFSDTQTWQAPCDISSLPPQQHHRLQSTQSTGLS